MRFLLGTTAMLLVAACSGASSSDLFGAPGAESSPTEPRAGEATPVDEEPARAPEAKDAQSPDVVVHETKDASVDAKADAKKDASVVPDPTKCNFDSECDEGLLCNWRTDVCAAPGPNGAACKRDLECTDGLCNWKLETCSDPAPAGTACRRNKECASGSCGANSLCK